jgi:hypothetical protein
MARLIFVNSPKEERIASCPKPYTTVSFQSCRGRACTCKSYRGWFLSSVFHRRSEFPHETAVINARIRKYKRLCVILNYTGINRAISCPCNQLEQLESTRVYQRLEFQTIRTSHSRVLRVFGEGTFLARQAAPIEVYTRTLYREPSGLLSLRWICPPRWKQIIKSPGCWRDRNVTCHKWPARQSRCPKEMGSSDGRIDWGSENGEKKARNL